MALETKFKVGHNYQTLEGEEAKVYDIVPRGYDGEPRILGSITRQPRGRVELVSWSLGGNGTRLGNTILPKKITIPGFVNVYKSVGYRREHGDVVTTIHTGQVFETRTAALQSAESNANYLATIDISQEVEE